MKVSLVIAPLLALAVLALSLSPAVAVSGPGCLPTPLPSAPGASPSFSMNVQDGPDRMRVTLWRQQCRDSSDVVLLLRATPTAGAPFMCVNRWYLDQDVSRFYVTFLSAITGSAFCERLFGPATIIVESSDLAAGEPATFDEDDDFSLIYYGSSDDGTQYIAFRLDVPYPSPPGPVLPPLPPPPTITIVATGCNPCHSGQTVGFNGNVNNPGPAIQAELKAGARFPDGSILPLASQVVTLASGASVLTLAPAQTLPAGLPAIDLLVEAAILEPVLGVTLSRHSVTLHLLP